MYLNSPLCCGDSTPAKFDASAVPGVLVDGDMWVDPGMPVDPGELVCPHFLKPEHIIGGFIVFSQSTSSNAENWYFAITFRGYD